jgi:hypothetical protein
LLRRSNGKVLNVEFTRYPFPRFDSRSVVDGIQIDKLIAMADRHDPKDYVDVYFRGMPAAPRTGAWIETPAALFSGFNRQRSMVKLAL